MREGASLPCLEKLMSPDGTRVARTKARSAKPVHIVAFCFSNRKWFDAFHVQIDQKSVPDLGALVNARVDIRIALKWSSVVSQ